jgi:hypothetical protein
LSSAPVQLDAIALRFFLQATQDPMTDPQKPAPSPPTREERLAAKLRENLRRRKTQARAQATAPAPAPESD